MWYYIPNMNSEKQTSESSDKFMRRAAAAGIALGVGFVGVGVGQAVENNTKNEQKVASIAADFEHNESIYNEIIEQASAEVDPANVVGIFDIDAGTTVNSLSIDIAHIQDLYQDSDKETQDFIDYTLLESGKAQGSYDLNDTFVVSKVTIDGRDTLIVQDGEGFTTTLPSPTTR